MKLLKKLMITCIFAVLSCITLCGCGKKVINLNDYVTIEMSGYSGYGEAKVVFDKEAFREDCKKIKIKNQNVASMYGNVADYYEDFCFHYKLDEKKNLSNGDTVKLTWSCEDGLVSSNTSATLKYSDMSVTVSDLEEAPTFDVFEGLYLEYERYSPFIVATIKGGYTDDFKYYVTDTFNNKKNQVTGLANGDVITVEVSQKAGTDGKLKSMDEIVEVYGGLPEHLTKEFTVSGVGEYVMKLSDIPEKDLAALDKEARAIIESYQMQVYTYEECAVELIEKAAGFPYISSGNTVCLIYKLTVPGENGFDFYWSAEFPNVIKNADGSLSYNLADQEYPYGTNFLGAVSGEGFIRNGRFHVGYETMEELKEAVGLDDGTWDIEEE